MYGMRSAFSATHFTLDGTMDSALGYLDLSMDHVDSVLSQKGELLVSLPGKHARACMSFIGTVQAVQSWSPRRTPFLARLWPLVKGLLVTIRILVAHSKLFELSRVIVLNSSAQTWEQHPDGTYLFRFVRKQGAV